jgi:hypothetical protein
MTKLTESQVLKKYADLISEADVPYVPGPEDPNFDPIERMPSGQPPAFSGNVIPEDASTFEDNAQQAKGIIYLCERYIEACNAGLEENAYELASEIVQLALELERSEENFDSAEELSGHEEFSPR